MFAHLPKAVQEQVIHYLSLDDFCSAKVLYDTYRSTEVQPAEQSPVPTISRFDSQIHFVAKKLK